MSISRMNNWSEEDESMLNKQINLELEASHTYLYLSTLLSHDSISYISLAGYLKGESIEETRHANRFIDYQIKRGGKPVLGTLSNPDFKFIESNESYL